MLSFLQNHFPPLLPFMDKLHNTKSALLLISKTNIMGFFYYVSMLIKLKEFTGPMRRLSG